MADWIVDDREDYRDWINNLIENMSDEEKAEYSRKIVGDQIDAIPITDKSSKETDNELFYQKSNKQ